RNYPPSPSYGACINRRVFEFIARANLSDGETLNFARVFHVLPRDLCTFEISDFGCLDCSARIALDAVLRDFWRQSIVLRGFIDAGLHKTAYHVSQFVQPSSVAVTLCFPTQIAQLLLGKTWQIKLYSSAFECATIRNVNFPKMAV